MQSRVARVPRPDGGREPAAVDVVVDEIGPPPAPMHAAPRHRPHRRDARDAPSRLPRLRLVAVARQRDRVAKERWIEKAEDEWGEWGTVYHDDDGRVLGSMQYGPPQLFPRAADLPAGPAVRRRRAGHLRLPRRRRGAVGRAVALPRRDRRGARQGRGALEAFAYRYPEGESTYERFLVHRTVFPRDFLEDFGFLTVRAQGSVELAGSSSAGCSRSRRAAGEGAAGRAGGVHAGAGAAAPVGSAAAAGAGVGERRAGDRDEPPVVRAVAERQPEDAERPVVDDLARGKRRSTG